MTTTYIVRWQHEGMRPNVVTCRTADFADELYAMIKRSTDKPGPRLVSISYDTTRS